MLSDSDSAYETTRFRGLGFKVLQLLPFSAGVCLVELLNSFLMSGVTSFENIINFDKDQPVMQVVTMLDRW